MLRLIDFFADWRANGLFANLGNWTPWDSDAHVTKSALDWQYFGNRSGWRSPSPLLVKFLPPYRVLDNTQIAELDTILESLYSEKWNKLWNAFHLSYTIGNDVDYTDTLDSSGRKDGGYTETGSVNSKTETKGSTTGSVVPLGSSANTYTEINKSDVDTTTEQNKLYNTTDKTHTTGEMYSDKKTRTVKGKRGGISYSQAVKDEIDLRLRTFFDIIFTDVDDVLTIPYWGGGL